MKNSYESPLSARYASAEIRFLLSPDKKFCTRRRLWIALAESEMELGLPITQGQIGEMRCFADDINYDVAGEREKIVRHSVMAHVYVYGEQCPKARPIIHLGATFCYVGDNTDIIAMTGALRLLRDKLVGVIHILSHFAVEYKDLPTLALMHYQPTQPITVSKRATLWIQDLLVDLEDVEYQLGRAELLGSKGTTGTQASFLELSDSDYERIKALDRKIAEKTGYSFCFAVSSQTCSRKLDSQTLSILNGIAQSAVRFSNDIRPPQHMEEIEEPFERGQIGSSTMAYKHNPMRSEHIASPARHIIIGSLNPAITTATQWFERTLSGSANKCPSVPGAFLTVDRILDLYSSVADGLVVHPKVIKQHLLREPPSMATENTMMDAVKRGAGRQQLHGQIRVHSMEVTKVIKEQGDENNLLDRIVAGPVFSVTREELSSLVDPSRYTGCAAVQTQKFVSEVINSVLKEYDSIEVKKAEVNL